MQTLNTNITAMPPLALRWTVSTLLWCECLCVLFLGDLITAILFVFNCPSFLLLYIVGSSIFNMGSLVGGVGRIHAARGNEVTLCLLGARTLHFGCFMPLNWRLPRQTPPEMQYNHAFNFAPRYVLGVVYSLRSQVIISSNWLT